MSGRSKRGISARDILNTTAAHRLYLELGGNSPQFHKINHAFSQQCFHALRRQNTV